MNGYGVLSIYRLGRVAICQFFIIPNNNNKSEIFKL